MSRPRWLPGLLPLLLAGLVMLTALEPGGVQSASDLLPGKVAVIAEANGDPVNLRSRPNLNAAILDRYPEGTSATILAGPTLSDDWLWYEVKIGKKRGFMVADFLWLPAETGGKPTKAPTKPSTQPPTSAWGNATIVNTGGDPINCRTRASVSSAIITMLWEGETIALNGEAKGNWQPVICANQAGWIHVDYLSTSIASVPTATATRKPRATKTPMPTQTDTPKATATKKAGPSKTAQPTLTPSPQPTNTAKPTRTPEPPRATKTPSAPTSGPAVITGTNGWGARCRTTPSLNGAVITSLSEGARVLLNGAPTGGWQPIICANQDGYVLADFVTILPTPTPTNTAKPTKTSTPSPTRTPSPTATRTPKATLTPTATRTPKPTKTPTSAPVTSGPAVIANTYGLGARCRAAPSADSATIASLSEGTRVTLNGAPVGEWQPVRCAGQNGYVFADFVSILPTPTPTKTPKPTKTPTMTPTFTPTATATATPLPSGGVITNANGDLVNCRRQPYMTASVIARVKEGVRVALRGAAQNGWYPVICSGENGWISAQFIKPDANAVNTTPGPTRTPTPSASATATPMNQKSPTPTVTPTPLPPLTSLKPGNTAKVSNTNGQGVRLRGSAQANAAVVIVVPENKTVMVIPGSTGVWVAVAYQSYQGFIHMDYLVLVETKVTPEPTTGPRPLQKGDHALTQDAMNLRKKAAINAEVLAVLQPGTVVLITGERNGIFYPVKWGNTAGFLHGDYLQWTDAPLSTGGGGVSGPAGTGATNATGNKMVNYSMKYLGFPYIWATAGPNSFDCSGFTYWVTMNILNRDIGRGLWTQIVAGTPIAYGSLQPGDLVFFQNTYTAGLSHVGIYIGNNQFIHAENEDTGVRISSLDSQYYSTRYFGAVRLS